MIKPDHPVVKDGRDVYEHRSSCAIFLGVAGVTLRRWERTSRLVPAWRTPGGHRRDTVDELNSFTGRAAAGRKTVGYARVSSHDQKDDLQRQAERLESYAKTNAYPGPEIITDLGRGLNDKKRGLQWLIRMISRGEVGTLILTHKDRLLRFGADLIFTLCAFFGVRVVKIENEPEKVEDRLAQDVIELMTVFSARLYGRRAHQNRNAARC